MASLGQDWDKIAMLGPCESIHVPILGQNSVPIACICNVVPGLSQCGFIISNK